MKKILFLFFVLFLSFIFWVESFNDYKRKEVCFAVTTNLSDNPLMLAKTATVINHLKKQCKNFVLIDNGNFTTKNSLFFKKQEFEKACFFKTMKYNYLNLSLNDVEKNGKNLKNFIRQTDAKLLTENLKSLISKKTTLFDNIKISGLIFSENSNILPKSIKSSLQFTTMQDLQNSLYKNKAKIVFVNMKKSKYLSEINNFFIFAGMKYPFAELFIFSDSNLKNRKKLVENMKKIGQNVVFMKKNNVLFLKISFLIKKNNFAFISHLKTQSIPVKTFKPDKKILLISKKKSEKIKLTKNEVVGNFSKYFTLSDSFLNRETIYDRIIHKTLFAEAKSEKISPDLSLIYLSQKQCLTFTKKKNQTKIRKKDVANFIYGETFPVLITLKGALIEHLLKTGENLTKKGRISIYPNAYSLNRKNNFLYIRPKLIFNKKYKIITTFSTYVYLGHLLDYEIKIEKVFSKRLDFFMIDNFPKHLGFYPRWRKIGALKKPKIKK